MFKPPRSIVFLSMPTQSLPYALPDERTALLLEAARLLADELALLAAQDWEKLPVLKKLKVVTASRLRRLRTEAGAADGAPNPALESLIAEFESKSRSQIHARLDVIGNQILALQELSLHLHETLHVTLQPVTNRPLGNGGVVS